MKVPSARLRLFRLDYSLKMYAVNSTSFTSKRDSRKEFTSYLKDSGASAAFQKAMILLYRLPVKPDDLVEYFSEYFENGAKRLVRISLLQAERCYKMEELEKYQKRVDDSEDRIEELVNRLGISEEEFNERFIPEQIKQNNRLSILERYFKDLEVAEDRAMSDDLSFRGSSAASSAGPDAGYDWKVFHAEVQCLKHMEPATSLKEEEESPKEIEPVEDLCQMLKALNHEKIITFQ